MPNGLDQCGQRRLAADEARQRGRSRGSSIIEELGHESVATAPNVADRVLLPTVVADGPADLLDPGGQVRLGGEPVTPHAVEQLRLRHQPFALLDEVGEQVEGERLQVHAMLHPPQLAAAEIDRQVAEPPRPGATPRHITSGRTPQRLHSGAGPASGG